MTPMERVRAGSGSTRDCSLISGFTVTKQYVCGSGGIATEFAVSSGTVSMTYSNVYAMGKLLTTYKGATATNFSLTDWLGTKRVETSALGVVTGTYGNLPFGDWLQTVSGSDASSERHFTGKERNTESGLDNFGARYITGRSLVGL
jgi:hypothetical protein